MSEVSQITIVLSITREPFSGKSVLLVRSTVPDSVVEIYLKNYEPMYSLMFKFFFPVIKQEPIVNITSIVKIIMLNPWKIFTLSTIESTEEQEEVYIQSWKVCSLRKYNTNKPPILVLRLWFGKIMKEITSMIQIPVGNIILKISFYSSS